MSNLLKAGFGKGEIQFPQEIFPVESFLGVHDVPCARLMVLESGGMKITIAALELVNLPPKGVELCQEIIEEVTGTPRERIWVHVTHAISTMHEPGPMGPPDRRPPETEEDRVKKGLFFGAIEKAVRQAAGQAADSFGPARFGWGTGRCEVNVNRDVETPFGWWNGQNPDGPSNKTMTILRVESPEERPKGFLISYGIKPCAIDNAGMETGDRQVSADVCGKCSTMMEERFGVPAVFCVSAAGDQVPREQAWFEEAVCEGRPAKRDFGVEKGLDIVERLGAEMGRDAIAIAENTPCGETEAVIRHSVLSFPWPGKNGRPQGPGKPQTEYPVDGERVVTAEIFVVGGTAFVAEKPEVSCKTEMDLKAASPFRHTLLICMVNGGMKYMPDRSAYERNTFESQSSALQPGAAEHFVEVVGQELVRLSGKAPGGVDWSCKHNILIQNKDGTLTPMDEPYYQVEQVAPDTWKILSSGDHSYLVAGEKEAVSIDTGYGAGNIRAFLQTLTDKPVRNVINTHSHFDHTANNGYFEKAFMAEEALTRATIPYASFAGIDFIQDYQRVAIDEGFVYDLGGRTLEVFKIPDHTPDGIALLDRRERLLFTGDEFMEMGKMLNVSLTTFYGYLEKLMAHRGEFDRLCAGAKVFDASFLDGFYECTKYILAGHKGEPEQPQPRKPREMPKGPNGEIVYDRMMPHPGDGGAGRDGPRPHRDLYVVEHAGARIIYDINNV